jgi:acetoin utilization deacetylase AcuC-like enzyme
LKTGSDMIRTGGKTGVKPVVNTIFAAALLAAGATAQAADAIHEYRALALSGAG